MRALTELTATSNRDPDLNTEPPPLQDGLTDTCTGTERHIHEHANIDHVCPATVKTSSSREGSAGTSGSGEGPLGSGEESRGSSNRGEGSFMTSDNRKSPEDPGS